MATPLKILAVVITRPTIESSFAVHSTKSIPEFNHPEHPVLRVAIEVLELRRHRKFPVEVHPWCESGPHRSPGSFKAFEEVSKIVRGLADELIALEETSFDAEKSSRVYAFTRQVSTPAHAAGVPFANSVPKGAP
ncbi:hypothetical protein BOTBODRAFT_180345 [Botryobasidium botryosum FD-172 SS1]|uniref:Uncharacterized protein n=1 Tax=Botryobasidium botryosum (strain FD-172 SS1) TaxID=930990 RepID=A0A067M8J3_BOTB1|nr:hypothetical protein BOTBODRAFT_180345 [Botryobasidium botryosum FD-172 SS1]